MEIEAANPLANRDQSRIEKARLAAYNFFTRNLIAALLVFVVFSSYRNLLSLAGEEQQFTTQESGFRCKAKIVAGRCSLFCNSQKRDANEFSWKSKA
jgi:hypothetical protein